MLTTDPGASADPGRGEGRKLAPLTTPPGWMIGRADRVDTLVASSEVFSARWKTCFQGRPHLGPQHFQVASDGFDAAVEIRQVEFFVGGMDVVVGQTEAHQHARNPRVFVEFGDNGN